MAAKQPKPPATLLKPKSPINSDKSVNGNNDSGVTEVTTPTIPIYAPANSPIDETFSKLGIRRYNSRDNLLNNISNDNNNSDISGTGAAGTTGSGGGAVARLPTCNCTNISIMHLFHEMKQEFPTIPDPIVAQCVNENCHQRENCIQMLKNELALNPIPVQTYPAKVLQQHNINQQQHHQQQQRLNSPLQQKRSQSLTPSHPQPPQRHKNATATKPATLLRPIRAAPTQPPYATLQRLRSDTKNCAAQPANCDSGELVQNNNSNNNNNNCNISNNNRNLLKDVFSVQTPVCNSHGNNNNSAGECVNETCDMPATVTARVNANKDVNADCAPSSDFIATLNKVAATPPTAMAALTATRPRPRPNTLDLHTAQQQLQRQQLNKQLQQHLQQRSQLQQQQQQQQLSTDVPPEDTPHQQQQKPIRKAPLPPIAPKPVFHNNANANNHNQYNYNNNNSCGNSPQSQSGGSCSAESNLTSPISSCGESEISANIGLQSQNFALGHINNNRNINSNNNNHNASPSAAPSYQHHQQQTLSPLKSPIRHRSVITVQPEPPYTRDFIPPTKISTGALATSSNIAGSGSSTPTSQKSFTSVNLTLRQPTTAVPQSTIDISAGPASRGYGSGLTYSSTSFDARRGYQQNFHITVTDEGGVFNASRIRPRNSGYYSSIEERDSPGGPAGGVRQTSSATQQLQSPTSAQAVITSPTREEMCVPFENSALTETIRRQKTRRDKLATALRENKKKLNHVEEEINMLTETLSPGESERLDYEIESLRSDCQLMLNEIENIRRYGQLSDVERQQLQQQQQQQHQQQQQQQPFPRQRPPRPPTQQPPQSSYSYQQPPEIDSLQQQHHTAGSNMGGVGGNVAVTPPNSSHLVQSSNAYQQRQNYVSNQQTLSTDEEDYSDSNTDGGGDDDDDEPLERWPCSMCTFLNHPQLNICEACECVRILPGTVRIVHTAGGAASATTTPTPHPATLMATNSATAAAAASALAAAAPTVLGPSAPGGSGGDGCAGVGAVGSNARSPAASTSARQTAAAARPVAAE